MLPGSDSSSSGAAVSSASSSSSVASGEGDGVGEGLGSGAGSGSGATATVSVIVEPCGADCPASTLWSTTCPAGTPARGVVTTSDERRTASAPRAATASCRLRPTSCGTVTRPVDSTSCTSEPLGTVVPPAGSVATSIPWGTHGLFAVRVAPASSPAASRASRTSSSDRPARSSGTSTSAGPRETARTTAEPSSTCVSAVGSVPTASPSGTSSSKTSSRCGTSSALRSAVSATAASIPAT